MGHSPPPPGCTCRKPSTGSDRELYENRGLERSYCPSAGSRGGCRTFVRTALKGAGAPVCTRQPRLAFPYPGSLHWGAWPPPPPTLPLPAPAHHSPPRSIRTSATTQYRIPWPHPKHRPSQRTRHGVAQVRGLVQAGPQLPEDLHPRILGHRAIPRLVHRSSLLPRFLGFRFVLGRHLNPAGAGRAGVVGPQNTPHGHAGRAGGDPRGKHADERRCTPKPWPRKLC